MSHEVESLDTRIYHPDGQGRWVRLFTRVERDAAGHQPCHADALEAPGIVRVQIDNVHVEFILSGFIGIRPAIIPPTRR